jgi:peptidoglycan/xylan/chitin deacetylase (PgdA/CDA1 family)
LNASHRSITISEISPHWGWFGVLCIIGAIALMYAVPLLIRWLQVRGWRDRDGVLALTYDDGPDPVTTMQLLDLLDELGVRASFYLVGFRAEKNPDVLERLAGSEHQLATHTHTHKNAWKKPFWFEYADAMRAYHTIGPVIRARDAYRPPFGKVTLLTWLGMRLRGRRVHWWTVAANDTFDEFGEPVEVARRMLDDGERVVLMHCHHSEPHRRSYVLALTRALIEEARARGVELVTMRELERGACSE